MKSLLLISFIVLISYISSEDEELLLSKPEKGVIPNDNGIDYYTLVLNNLESEATKQLKIEQNDLRNMDSLPGTAEMVSMQSDKVNYKTLNEDTEPI